MSLPQSIARKNRADYITLSSPQNSLLTLNNLQLPTRTQHKHLSYPAPPLLIHHSSITITVTIPTCVIFLLFNLSL